MDGTLLDLRYDNHFWREFVPDRYARIHSLSDEQARQELFTRYKRVEGTMDWYCVDYWSRELDLDIARLKAEVSHLIAVHPHVEQFLAAVRRSGRQLALVTNAHHKSLSLKLARTEIGSYFDAVVCAHDFGLPKEAPGFWQRLQERLNFDPAATLLVDDSLSVLRQARVFGIGHLVAVSRPDSGAPAAEIREFRAIRDFSELMPVSRI